MIELVLISGYALVGLLAVRPVAGALAWKWMQIDALKHGGKYARYTEPAGEHWGWGVFSAVLLACVWPLVVLFVAQGRSSRWRVGAERTALLEARQRRIAKLEHELGIGLTRQP